MYPKNSAWLCSNGYVFGWKHDALNVSERLGLTIGPYEISTLSAKLTNTALAKPIVTRDRTISKVAIIRSQPKYVLGYKIGSVSNGIVLLQKEFFTDENLACQVCIDYFSSLVNHEIYSDILVFRLTEINEVIGKERFWHSKRCNQVIPADAPSFLH
jgi:hypothetical protein